MALRTIEAVELKVMLDLHREWLVDPTKGKRADLRSANLSSADLSWANLRSADLSSANLSSANLSSADLSSANLSWANLSSANLSSADLSSADLSSADLSSANLADIKADYFKVLASAKAEVIGIYDALLRGKIDGSAYQGECACLVGTVANVRGENYQELGIDLRPDSGRPAERWFMGIKKGDIPQSNSVSKITAEWTEEFAKEQSIELPKYKLVSSTEFPTAFQST